MTTFRHRIEFRPGEYPRVRFCVDGHEGCVYLHRLVAFADGKLPHLWSYHDVHHKDADPWNNNPDNLDAMPRWEHADREAHVANLSLPRR